MNNKKRILVIIAILSFWLFNSALFAQEGLKAALALQNVFVKVAKQLKQSVVNIRVVKEIPQTVINGNGNAKDLNELLRQFFGRVPGWNFNVPGIKEKAMGSGVVFDSNGYILTNNHVVKNAVKIKVKFNNGDELPAEIVGQDPQTDLAVIKVESRKPLVAAKFAESEKVETGQWCMAVGNPLGLDQTVTVGVVSAVGRSGIGAAAIEDFIQTDASINPGNSGGPLVNIRGEVIGINTLIFAAPGSGIGFAIPSDMAVRIANQIITNGTVERPYLGITMQPVTEQLAEHFDLPNHNGAVVISVAPNSPADKAGLQPLDIIVKIDGKNMLTTNDVQKYVLSRNITSKIKLGIYRNGNFIDLNVKLEKMPAGYGLPESEKLTLNTKRHTGIILNRLGFKVMPLTDELRKNLQSNIQHGVVVKSVEQGSLAEDGGLKPGDIITRVNGKKIDNETDLIIAIKKEKKKKSSVFVVYRAGQPMFLVIEHSKK